MALQRCEKGHFYDPEKHSSCPYCGVQDLDIEPTRPKQNLGGRTTPRAEENPTLPSRPNGGGQVRAPEPGVTVGIVRKKMGVDPVVGWLVSIEGVERGRDYRIRSERNFIGRAPSMDICINGDDAVSRENHAIVSFNPRKNTFLLHPGDGRGIVYLNEEEVVGPSPLAIYDVVEVGQTKLMFIPFCGERFQWT